MIRLSELRNEKGISQRTIAKELNISQGTYNNWENSNTQPSLEQLIELSKYFSVSVDYIIGNSDELGIINIEEKLTTNQIDMLHYFNKLNDTAQKLLLDLCKTINSTSTRL